MAFSPRPDRGGNGSRHLDLTGDRDVVFCHACSHEWYRDEHGLECPRCHGEICEIITPENDPRDIQPDLHLPPLGHNHNHHHDHVHPDPDEDDIGAAFPPHGFSPSDNMNRNRQNRPVDPHNGAEIFARFQETLNMLGGFPPQQPGRPNREPLFGGSSPFGPPGGDTQTTTYTTPSGRATFSLITSTMGPRPGQQGGHHLEHPDHDHDHDHNRNFDIIFGNVMGGGNVRAPAVGQPGFENSIQNLLTLLLAPPFRGPNAVHGDAVYSQEALDRIISQLMEANPTSNAAPPATEDAIQKLAKKKLDKEMMGDSGKAECTICIDEMRLGDEVTVLPCKHWFHGVCVVLWLQEHNTCPICRNPIEKRDDNGGSGNGDASGGSGTPRDASPGEPAGSSGLGGWFSSVAGSNNPWATGSNTSPAGASGGPSSSFQNRQGRTTQERLARLNAIRNLAIPSRDGQFAPPESPTSSRIRRDSWSPTSPPPGASSGRERSPTRPRPDRTNSSSWSSQRSGRSGNDNSNTGGNGGGSSNPINWLRDRFSGSGGSSGNGSGNGRGNGSGSNNNGSGRRRS